MKDINDILAKHFSGQTTAEEEAIVSDWKKVNEEEYSVLSSAWNELPTGLTSDFTFKTFDHQKAWEKVDPQLNETQKETKVVRMRLYQRLAAACAILLVSLAGFWFLSGNDYHSVGNDDGMAKTIQLPDGSTVWLANNAELAYNKDFKNDRSLTLKGEAYFDVAHDKAHPFVIATEQGDIEVLGTAFNIDASQAETVVTVERGKVELRNDEGKVQLTPGEMAIANESSVSGIKSADENYLSWKTGRFVFENTPIEEAVADLNKFYPTRIELAETADRNGTFNGTFDNELLDKIINAIVLTQNLEADYGEEGVIRLK